MQSLGTWLPRAAMRGLTAAVICLTGSSCESTYDSAPTRGDTQQDIVSTHLAVLSVTPWEEISTALQPTFTMTANDALAKAIPTTQTLEEKLIEAFLLKLGIGLPSATTTSIDTNKVMEESKTVLSDDGTSTTTGSSTSTDTSDSTTTKKSGEAPTATPPTATGAKDLSGLSKTDLGQDQITALNAATALYQEAQSLNNYVKFAVTKPGYKAYYVRLQLSALPFSRNIPSDLYADLSFFIREQSLSDDFGFLPRARPQLGGTSTGTSATTTTEATQPQDGNSTIGAATAAAFAGPGECEVGKARDWMSNLPEAIPLLVTDNLESILRSRSIDRQVQLALALSAMIQGIGAKIDTGYSRDKLESLVGRDYNGLFTVGQSAANTLRIRIGAAQQVTNQYGMNAQTHSISLLLLVPESYVEQCKKPAVSVVAATSLRDAKTGKEMRRYGRKDPNDLFEEALADYVDPALVPKGWLSRKLKSPSKDDRCAVKRFTVCLDNAQNGLPEAVPAALDCPDTPDQTTAQDAFDEIADLLWVAISENDFRKFSATARCSGVGTASYAFLWQDLVASTASSGIHTTDVNLQPFKKPAAAPPRLQTALLLDNGMVSTIRLQAAQGTEPKKTEATIEIHQTGRRDPRPFAATKIERDGQQLVLQFPSLQAWGANKFEEGAENKLHLKLAGDDVVPSYNLLYQLQPSAEDAGFEIKSTTKVVNTNKEGKGILKVVLTFTGTATRIVLTPDGAETEDQSKISEQVEKDSAKESQIAVINLRNLNEGEDVKIVATGFNGKVRTGEKTITLKVKVNKD